MADIDQLSIQIETSATGADKNLASLASGLNRLQKALDKIDVNTFSSKMHKVAESVNEISSAVNGINPKNLENLATVVSKVGRNIESVSKKVNKLNTSVDGNKLSSEMDKVAQGADKVKNALGKTDGDVTENIAESAKEISDAFEKTGENAQKTSGVLSSAFDGFAKIYAFGGAVGKLADGLDSIANKANNVLVSLYKFDPEEGIKDFLKLPTKILPMLGVVEDKVKSKLSGVKEAFSDMGKTAMGVFNKMENFFAKIGQRFTFTLLRKAINAVIKDLNDAMVSLANFSGTTGREFNSAMSSMASSAKWLGASIVGAFAPLASAISPYIDALIEKLVSAIRVIGMFFAALTGKSTIAVANKGMQKFGASTEKAAKSAKKLESYLLGIDELNVFQKNEDNDSGGGAGGGSPYNWEEVDIPDWLKNLADKFRDLLEKLLAPIKEAWDRTKAYVVSGLKYMLREIWDLIKAIGKDFLEMWNEEATIRMLENIFRIIGDIAYTVGNLAKRFREAWEEGLVGLHIFEHIRDIFATLIQHVRNVTKYMRDWSDTLNFRPMLHTFDELLVSINKVADFIGGVFEDVMKNIVFKYIKWMIEDGIPHLNHTIKSIIDAFDFSKIREDLVPLEEAIERVLESLDEGFVNAVGNVGKALAEWTNSKEFSQFLEDIAGILNRITPERIEKFFSALGYAILDIVKAIAKFVHSNAFQNFLDKLLEWFDKASAKDMAKVINGIAGAIAAFKFVAFVGTGFKNFLQFIALARLANLGGGFKAIGSALGDINSALKTADGKIASFVKGIGTMNTEVQVVSTKFTGLRGAFNSFSTGITDAGSKLSVLSKAIIGISAGIAEFSLISSAVKDLGTNAENVGMDIIKIIGAVGVAWVAFSMVFESTPIGALIALIVGLVAALKGLADALEMKEAERFGTMLHNALATPGGVPVEELFGNVKSELESLAAGFDKISEHTAQFDDANTRIEDTAYSIDKIRLSLENGVMTAEQAIPEMTELIGSLADAITTKIGAAGDVLLSTFASGGLMAKALEEAGFDVENARDRVIQSMDDQEKKVYELQQKMNEVEFNSDEYWELYNDMVQLTAGTDEASTAMSDFETYTNTHQLNWEAYLNADGLNTEKLQSDFGEIVELGKKVNTESETNLTNAASVARTTLCDPELAKQIEDGIPGALKVVQDQVGIRGAEIANTLQEDAVKKISTVINDAGEEWEKMPWWEKILHTEGKEGYIRGKAVEYANDVVKPLSETIETDMSQLGIDGAGWADDAVNQILGSMFNVEGLNYNTGAIRFSMSSEWGSIITETVDTTKATAETQFEEVSKYAMKGATNGMNYNSGQFVKAAGDAATEGFNKFEKDSGVGSPSWMYAESSMWMMMGAKEGVENNKASFIDAVGLAATEAVNKFKEVFTTEIPQAFNTLFTETLPNLFGIEMWQPIYDGFVENVLAVHFEALKLWLDEKLLELVGVDFWQPYFDTLMKEVFQVNFDNFRSWFTEDAITPWWEEDLLPWFAVDKWNAEIIEPVDETIRTHIEDFIKFWQDKVKKWFQDDVEPWFKKERWNTYGLNMKEGIYGGFKGIVQSVGGVINGLIDVFNNGIENIVNAVNSLIDSFNTLAGALGLPSIGSLTAPKIPRITIPSFYNGGFTPYGNPSSYSLFAAGENGVAEMVGQVGGRPAVASNEEITGIRDAVNESGYRQEELLGQIINIATALLNKDPILIGDRQIAEANRRGESLLGMAIIS